MSREPDTQLSIDWKVLQNKQNRHINIKIFLSNIEKAYQLLHQRLPDKLKTLKKRTQCRNC